MLDKISLELWNRLHEGTVLFLRAETEDWFDHGTVVPAAVEQYDLAAAWKLLDVALEVPLTGLHI